MPGDNATESGLSSAPNLAGLPEELLTLVCSHVGDRETLGSLSSTSKQFKRLAYQTLYKTFSVDQTSLPLVLAGIIGKSGNISEVNQKRMRLVFPHLTPTKIAETLKELFERTLTISWEPLSRPEMADDRSMMLATLAPVLPNLRTVCIPHDVGERASYTGVIGGSYDEAYEFLKTSNATNLCLTTPLKNRGVHHGLIHAVQGLRNLTWHVPTSVTSVDRQDEERAIPTSCRTVTYIFPRKVGTAQWDHFADDLAKDLLNRVLANSTVEKWTFAGVQNMIWTGIFHEDVQSKFFQELDERVRSAPEYKKPMLAAIRDKVFFKDNTTCEECGTEGGSYFTDGRSEVTLAPGVSHWSK